jgi:hypothetical protein
MNPNHRARFLANMRRVMAEMDHEEWVCEVEGWFSQAMNAALLGRPIEPLAWPIRTVQDLDRAAEAEYGSLLTWGRSNEFEGMDWKELKREANVRLLTDFTMRVEKTDDDLPLAWRQTHAEARSWAERTYDKLIECDDHDRPPSDPHHGHEHE